MGIPTIFWFVLVGIIGLLALPYLLYHLIPASWARWYAGKRDSLMDVVITLLFIGWGSIMLGIVIHSTVEGGPILVDAMGMSEGYFEIFIMSVIICIFAEFHAAMQLKYYIRNLKR